MFLFISLRLACVLLQVGFFPGEKAYTVSHQTAEMLDKVLRVGVLGEDNDEQEEFPK